jgi:hypothetical protein
MYCLGAVVISQIFIAQTTPDISNIGEYIFTLRAASVDSMPKAFAKLWEIAMDGNLYKLVCSLGLLIAVFAVGFWCVKFYHVLDEGGLRPAVNELVFPLLLVILLANGGDNMRKATLGSRDLMNGFNQAVNQVISIDVSMQTALNVLATNDFARSTINSFYNSCNASVNINAFGACVQQREVAGKVFIKAVQEFLPSSGNADWQEQVGQWKASWDTLLAERSKVLTPEEAQKAAAFIDGVDLSHSSTGIPFTKPKFNALDYSTYSSEQDMKAVQRTIMSFRTAFLYIIEVMMLVTGLIGPVFLALSMFPIGTKPLIAWGTSFLSLGFCKICFSLISGLSAVAMVYTGPDKIDMTVAAVVLGLLAPILSFSIASGSGLSALTSISYAAQGAGFNTGVGFYDVNSGQGISRNGEEKSETKQRL